MTKPKINFWSRTQLSDLLHYPANYISARVSEVDNDTVRALFLDLPKYSTDMSELIVIPRLDLEENPPIISKKSSLYGINGILVGLYTYAYTDMGVHFFNSGQGIYRAHVTPDTFVRVIPKDKVKEIEWRKPRR